MTSYHLKIFICTKDIDDVAPLQMSAVRHGNTVGPILTSQRPCPKPVGRLTREAGFERIREGARLRIAKHDGKRFQKGLRFAKPRCFSRPFPRGSHNHRCRNIARPRVRRHQERQTRPHPAVQTKRCAPVPCGPSDDAPRRSAQKVRIRATVSKQGLPDFCSMPRQSRKIIGRVRAASAGDGAPRFAG